MAESCSAYPSHCGCTSHNLWRTRMRFRRRGSNLQAAAATRPAGQRIWVRPLRERRIQTGSIPPRGSPAVVRRPSHAVTPPERPLAPPPQVVAVGSRQGLLPSASRSWQERTDFRRELDRSDRRSSSPSELLEEPETCDARRAFEAALDDVAKRTVVDRFTLEASLRK